MPSKYIKDDTYDIIEKITVEESQKEKRIIKDSEIIERLLRLGIEQERKNSLIKDK